MFTADIVCTVKMFVDNASFFPFFINQDLKKVSDWVLEKPNKKKQAQEIIFSRKMTKLSHPQICLLMYLFLVLIFKNL